MHCFAALPKASRCGFAYLHLIEPRIDGSRVRADRLPLVAPHWLRDVFTGLSIAAGSFKRDVPEFSDLIAFGGHSAAAKIST